MRSRMRLTCWLAGFMLLLPPAPGWTGEVSDPHVVQFAPQGTVKNIRQASARFSDPMVPLGDPRIADPFDIHCPEKGAGRWVDSRNWAYDFDRDLPAGVRCTFQLRDGLRSLAGKVLGGQREFAFSTGGPAIRSSIPRQGSEQIHEDQAFLLILDAEPTEASLLEHVSFTVEGIPERIGVRIFTGEEREAILKSHRFYLSRWTGKPVVILQARQRFPNTVKVNLVWGKGVASLSGVAAEKDQVLPFKVREPFLAKFHCEREHARAACIPVTPMEVKFTAPVPWEQARGIALVGPKGQRRQPEPDHEKEQFIQSVIFKGPFPESAAFEVRVPAGLTDDAGRALQNADRFPLQVKTEAFPPLAKFSARFGILEWKADPTLPVTLRNLEPEVMARVLRVEKENREGVMGKAKDLLDQVKGRIWRISPEQRTEILPWLRKVAMAKRDTSVFGPKPERAVKTVQLPKPHGAKAFEIVGIPLNEPGLYIVEMESLRLGSALLGKPRPMYVPTAALVTNLSVHFKWAKENSIAWVTTLDDGKPVAGAHVTVQDCEGKVLWQGESDTQGIAWIDRLPSSKDLPRCRYPTYDFTDYRQSAALHQLDGGLLVIAQTQDDLSFVHTSWDQGIEPWRFRLPGVSYRRPVIAHTVFDRSLFRAGETVHMKHLLRREALRGFSTVPEKDLPTHVVIQHAGSEEKFQFPVTWDAQGMAESAWSIPKEAKLGTYTVTPARMAKKPPSAPASRARGRSDDEWVVTSWSSGEFRVEEFRVPLMKAILRPPTDPLVAATGFPIDLSVQYLAGGGARNHPVTIRAQIRPRGAPAFEEYEGFVFSNGLISEGITRRGREEEEETEGEPDARKKPKIHQRRELVLDAAGTARTTITRLPSSATPQEVLVEMEFRDPNGETQTVSTRVPIWPADRLVGIRPEGWAASKDLLKAQVAVVDLSGKPVAGSPVRVDLFEQKTYSHRKRLVGGFYAYDHVMETRKAGELCAGETNAKGILFCEGKPPVSGNLVLQATLTGEDGRVSGAHQEVWVAGSEEWWFDVHDSDRMELLPEKRRYEPGETARIQVRMPFRQATALVTVERGGVLVASVFPLSGKEPAITVPVLGDYAPNVFVSVLVVRGRVGGIQPTALVDLGRPAFKLGVTEIRVGWRDHELKVKVSADRQVYKVREKARVKVAVRTAEGKAPPAGSEVALAAVDEGLLELSPNRSWNLLEAMMRQRGYGVRTATAQMQVVGKRHYGLKALPQGGGGGRQTTRELFDTLLLWKGRVPLDAQGEAEVEVPLNDSLTSFRIVAVATGGLRLFGTGSTTIRSTQDLMVLPGIAPLVREGDRFYSEVTIRNATDRKMDIEVTGRVEGLKDLLAPRTLSLSAGEARAVHWELTAPFGVRTLRYEMDVKERGGASDRVRVTQQVVPAVPVRTYQATLFRWEGVAQQPVERPSDALPGRGGIQVAFRPTLLEGMSGVREWMRQYPYTCLEQKVSQAVALRDERLWREIAGKLPTYLDADGLLKYFPKMLWGSEVLTSYVMAVIHEAGWAIPDEALGRMESGLRKFIEGKIVRRSELPTADLSIRKMMALEALARHGKADPKLLSSLTIEPNLWPTSAVMDWWSVLHRMPGIPMREERLKETEQIIRSRLNMQGTVMGFSTEQTDHLWWMMASPDQNAVRLILHLVHTNQWKEDLPRLVRGAIGRQKRGAWDLTLANAWGVLAVEKFSQAFEKTPVTGTSAASLKGAAQQLEWSKAPKGKTLAFPWPEQREDLVVDHQGTGHPWVTVQAQAAIPLKTSLSTGYRITKTLMPIEQREEGRWSRGDIVRVRLEIEAQADRTWVVVSDPVPAGASHLGTGLGRDSRILTGGETVEGRAWPAFEERSFEAFRAYYRYVPKGRFVVEYTIRLNQSGRFQLPPTRVEALYAPEMFGELPNARMEVEP
ncbi:MAG: alpha-2-macroglobulin [Nitrospirae bacterium]|nr:alpha-2-macroglobulin [Nitrospirota bacterium]